MKACLAGGRCAGATNVPAHRRTVAVERLVWRRRRFFAGAAMFPLFVKNSFLFHLHGSSCWFSTAVFSLSFQFIAAIVILFRQNFRSSIKRNPFSVLYLESG
jgi:hypothetical protein